MSRLFRRVGQLALLTVLAGCGSSNTSTGTLPTTLPTVLTETFSGTLVKNSAYTHPFTVSDAGDVSIFVLISADTQNPDNNAVPVGVSLGTWNGNTCSIVIAKDNVLPGDTLSGRATAAGNLCVRVYDIGFVPSGLSYELLIDHY